MATYMYIFLIHEDMLHICLLYAIVITSCPALFSAIQIWITTLKFIYVTWAPWHLKTQATVFLLKHALAKNEETIKAPYLWFFLRGIPRRSFNSPRKGKWFRFMTSSCSSYAHSQPVNHGHLSSFRLSLLLPKLSAGELSSVVNSHRVSP